MQLTEKQLGDLRKAQDAVARLAGTLRPMYDVDEVLRLADGDSAAVKEQKRVAAVDRLELRNAAQALDKASTFLEHVLARHVPTIDGGTF